MKRVSEMEGKFNVSIILLLNELWLIHTTVDQNGEIELACK